MEQEIDEAEIDCLMIQASQQVEQQIEASLQFEQQQSTEDSPRFKCFGSPVSSEELLEKVEQTVPTCTRANTKWAASTWTNWRANRRGDKPPELVDITNQQLSEWLPRFVVETRRHDGKKYPGNTLHNLCAGIQCFVRDNRLSKNGDAVDIFSEANSTFA